MYLCLEQGKTDAHPRVPRPSKRPLITFKFYARTTEIVVLLVVFKALKGEKISVDHLQCN